MTIYTNDESDRSLRQRNFYLTVYLIPIAIVAIICGFIYWASSNNYLGKTDTMYGYLMSLTPAVLLSIFNKRNWLKMPDGTYHNLKGIPTTPKLNFTEPTEYKAEFYYSKSEKATTILSGLALLGSSIWLEFKSAKTIWGLPEVSISNIVFDNVQINASAGMKANFVTGAVFKNGSRITASSGNAITTYNASISGINLVTGAPQ